MEKITIQDAITLFKAQIEILLKYSDKAGFDIERIAHIQSPSNPDLATLLAMQEEIKAAFSEYSKVQLDLWYSFWPKGYLCVWK